MFLIVSNNSMNFEALGRYTHATEQAKTKILETRNAFARLSRTIACADYGSGTAGCEYDFEKIQALVAEAEQAHVATLAAIAAANHEATACDKPPIKLYKASAA